MIDDQAHNRFKHGVTAGERRLSLILLGVLALIAGVMLVVQGRYDPGAWQEQAQSAKSTDPGQQTAAAPAVKDMDAAPGLQPLSSAENYTRDTLSDKIDGKADLYLAAGFQGLACRRFTLAGVKNRWLERLVYDMGSLRNAYTVFSFQGRQDIEPLDLTPFGYRAGNGLFFVHGPFYVEIIGSEDSPEMHKGLKTLAAAFIATHPVKTEDLAELRLLPADHRVAGLVKLAARGAFGIDGLDGIFTAAYARGQAEALAFVSRRATPAEAEALAAKFDAFWLDYGGQEVAPPADLPGARIVLILDNHEIVLAQGDYLMGVHEATDLQFGLELVKQLQRRITGSTP
jgi:Family of unknown function (DUF6599)